MKKNPQLDDEPLERPTREYVDAQIKEYVLGERQELQDVDESDLPDWASMDDELLQITLVHEYQGNKIEETFSFRYYQNPDPRSNYGKFLSEYGTPEEGKVVTLAYNKESEPEIDVGDQ